MNFASSKVTSNLKCTNETTTQTHEYDNRDLLGFIPITPDNYQPVFAPTPEDTNKISLIKGKTLLVKRDSATGQNYLKLNNQIRLPLTKVQTGVSKIKEIKVKKILPKPPINKRTIIPKCIKLYSPDKHIMLQTANTIRVKPSFYDEDEDDPAEVIVKDNKKPMKILNKQGMSSVNPETVLQVHKHDDFRSLKQDLQELANKKSVLERDILNYKKQLKDVNENVKQLTSQVYRLKVNEANRRLKHHSKSVQCELSYADRGTQTERNQLSYYDLDNPPPLKKIKYNSNEIVQKDVLDIENAHFIFQDESMQVISNELLELTNKTPEIIGNNVNMGYGMMIPQITRQQPRIINDETWKYKLVTCFKHCDVPDNKGDFPIHNAVLNDDLAAVKRQCTVLKLKKIPIDIENTDGHTPLHLAIIHTVHYDIIEQLLEFGAQFSMVDNRGNNCYHLAITYKFLPRLYGMNLLGSEECINNFNYDGVTPLHLCTIDDKLEEAKILLKLGVNMNIRDQKSGRTPLFHSVENKAYKIVELLLGNGADRRIESYMGLTPLDIFEKDKGNTTLIRLFSLTLTKENSHT